MRVLAWFAAAFCLGAACVGGPVAEANQVDDAMAMPKGLEPAVKFWESVFTRVSPNQCLFHDRDDLRIVYLRKAIPGATRKAQARNIRRYAAALRVAMLRLADGRPARTLIERRVEQVTPSDSRNRRGYTAASERVRCQRGVDLKPSLARSRQHERMVKQALRREGVPTDLAYLPHLESGYNVRALSKAGARGLWQLMPATARLHGVHVSKRNDQRSHASTSTRAAAGILRGYYERTRSWPLAITAYNYGINGVERAIRRYGTDYMKIRDRHQTRIFGFAAKNYYPSFLAVRNVAEGRLLSAGASRVGVDSPQVASATVGSPSKTSSY
jgi:membrane-bound lytic murein transglycosylase D